MPILHVLLYLLLIALAWLFRASYIGWLGPYIFAAAVLLPLVILLASLPSMTGLRIHLPVFRSVSTRRSCTVKN